MSSPKRTRRKIRPTTPPSASKARYQHDPRTPHHGYANPSASVHSYGANTFDYEAAITDSAGGTSFSPSKARAQAKVTHQNAVLRRWLTELLDQHQDRQHAHSSSSSMIDPNHPNPTATKTYSKPEDQVHPLIQRWETEYTGLQQQPPPNIPVGMADEILKALQDLMYANQSSDLHRRLVHQARHEELTRLRVADTEAKADANADQNQDQDQFPNSTDPTDPMDLPLLTELEYALSHDASSSLTSMAETAVLLGTLMPGAMGGSSGIPAHDTESLTMLDEISGPLMEHTSRLLELQCTTSSLGQLTSTLEQQLHLAQTDLAALEQVRLQSDRVGENLQAQTTQWQREAKQIALKMQEYNDRIATLTRSRPGTTGNDSVLVEDVVALQQSNLDRRKVVDALKERIMSFGGLPADLEASREEVKRARLELAGLKKRREELFEGMAS